MRFWEIRALHGMLIDRLLQLGLWAEWGLGAGGDPHGLLRGLPLGRYFGCPALCLTKSLATTSWSCIPVRNMSLYTVFNKEPQTNHLQVITEQEVKTGGVEERTVYGFGQPIQARRASTVSALHGLAAVCLYVYSIFQHIATVNELHEGSRVLCIEGSGQPLPCTHGACLLGC